MVGLSLVCAMACAVWSVSAASWYVSTPAAGANSGTSWANAWSPTSIVWASVQPGDTIYLDGGASSKTYNTRLTVGKNGTSVNRITIRRGVDAGHNGIPIFDGIDTELSNRQYITFIGIAWHNLFNTSTATFANAVMAPSTVGIKMDSCSWSNINNCMNFSSATGFWVTNCTAVATRGDAVIRASSAYGSGYDANIIENNDFEVIVNSIDGGGPDGIQTGNNITARNNIFRVRKITGFYTSNQHNDMFQAPGVYLAIYNNEFINVGDACIALGAWWDASVHANILIYNNIFRIVTPIDPYPEYIRIYNSRYIATMTNIVIANNLFVDNPGWNNISFSDYGSGGQQPTGYNLKLINNIFYNSGGGGCWRIDNSTAWTADTWDIRNNVYYPPASSYTRWLGTTRDANTWLAFGKELNGSVGQVIFTSYAANNPGNDYHLSASDTVAKDTGYDLSAFFTIDADDLTRSVPWDRGPYLFPGAGVPTLNVASATYSVSEATPTITITFGRSGSLLGVVTCQAATANQTATAGINYTSTSATLTWFNGDGADKTMVVPIHDTDMLDVKTFTVTISSPTGGAVIGAQPTTTVSITPTGVPADPLMNGHVWPATNGVFNAPFVDGGGYVWQNVATDNPVDGGSLRFTFTNQLGEYKFTMEVDAASGAVNSCFFNVNSEPISPDGIFDVVQLTTGFEDRDGTWRGTTGTFETPQYAPKTFTIPTGTNTLIIRGREPLKIKTVSLVQINPPTPTDPATVISVVCSTANNGYFKTNSTLNFNVLFSTNVVVTGTPRIELNSGGYATYDSGSGTDTLVFTYTTAAGENSQLLDYVDANSFDLNGGTIENDGVTSTLTLPTPGSAGSIESSAQIVIDTTNPTITLDTPVVTSDIRIDVSYGDTNFVGQSLNVTNVVVNYTGTLTGTPAIINSAINAATILINSLSGAGTAQAVVASGTAADLAGNVAPGATSGVASYSPPTPRTNTVIFRGTVVLNGVFESK